MQQSAFVFRLPTTGSQSRANLALPPSSQPNDGANRLQNSPFFNLQGADLLSFTLPTSVSAPSSKFSGFASSGLEFDGLCRQSYLVLAGSLLRLEWNERYWTLLARQDQWTLEDVPTENVLHDNWIMQRVCGSHERRVSPSAEYQQGRSKIFDDSRQLRVEITQRRFQASLLVCNGFALRFLSAGEWQLLIFDYEALFHQLRPSKRKQDARYRPLNLSLPLLCENLLGFKFPRSLGNIVLLTKFASQVCSDYTSMHSKLGSLHKELREFSSDIRRKVMSQPTTLLERQKIVKKYSSRYTS
eukprot:m.910280 g.910280  ORF g.910280 m.910280 type:complete len:300 (-) comp60109_c0_seq23:1311-2210(-)